MSRFASLQGLGRTERSKALSPDVMLLAFVPLYRYSPRSRLAVTKINLYTKYASLQMSSPLF
ncbi:hypothetical protein B1B04_07830 [Lysinibacillus sp. KCTC 33748]|nr:hypothetical protein B1B04_07830 [Lysinibacillus sp. KCTC 33748]